MTSNTNGPGKFCMELVTDLTKVVSKINITEISLFSKTVLSDEDRLHILESQINALKFTNLDFIIASDSEACQFIFKSKSDIFHKNTSLIVLCS